MVTKSDLDGSPFLPKVQHVDEMIEQKNKNSNTNLFV